MGNDTKRRTSKVALDYALVMIYAAAVAYHVSLLPLIFFSSSRGSRVISDYIHFDVVITRPKRDVLMTLYNS